MKKIFIWPGVLLGLDLIFLLVLIISSYKSFFTEPYGIMSAIFIFGYELTSLVIYFSLIFVSWLLSKKLKFLKIDIKLTIIYGLSSLIIALLFNFLTVFFLGLVLK